MRPTVAQGPYRQILAAVGFAVLLLRAADPSMALAATLFVANNGLDSTTCGAKSQPCRSISTAIDLAQPVIASWLAPVSTET